MASVGEKRVIDGLDATVVVADPDENGRIVVDVEGGGFAVVDLAAWEALPLVDPRIPTIRAAWLVVEPNMTLADARLFRTEALARAAATAEAIGVLQVPLRWRDLIPI